jgi:hypothetical protein
VCVCVREREQREPENSGETGEEETARQRAGAWVCPPAAGVAAAGVPLSLNLSLRPVFGVAPSRVAAGVVVSTRGVAVNDEGVAAAAAALQTGYPPHTRNLQIPTTEPRRNTA